jgi:hypothetical protein
MLVKFYTLQKSLKVTSGLLNLLVFTSCCLVAATNNGRSFLGSGSVSELSYQFLSATPHNNRTSAVIHVGTNNVKTPILLQCRIYRVNNSYLRSRYLTTALSGTIIFGDNSKSALQGRVTAKKHIGHAQTNSA